MYEICKEQKYIDIQSNYTELLHETDHVVVWLQQLAPITVGPKYLTIVH